VTHRRAVWRRAGYVVICDEFTGAGEHNLDVTFQVAPGRLSQAGPNRAGFDDVCHLAWTGDIPWVGTIRCGGPAPDDGWICPSLGIRTAAPRLTIAGRMTGPRATLLTVLACDGTTGCRVISRPAREGADVLGVIDGPSVDWIAARGIRTEGLADTDALLAICRTTGGHVVERSGIHLNVLDVDVAALGSSDFGTPAPLER
jgi:hypothetical protein